MSKQNQIVKSLELHWRVHYSDSVRIWRNDWASDQFEILALITFEQVKEVCSMFVIPLIEMEN